MNSFQAQYPLSLRKFWKKMFGSILGSVVVFVIIAPMLLLVAWALALADSPLTPWVGTIIFAFLAAIILYLVLRGWYLKVYIRRYYYDASGNFITIKKGVFAPREIHVQWQKIQDVYVDQDIIDRMMGLYDVHIASATMASGMEAHIDGVDQATAEGLKTYLLQRLIGPQNVGAAGTAGTSSTPGLVVPTTYQFPEPISSTQYPISSTYTTRSVIGIIFTSVFFAMLIPIWLALPEKNGGAPIVTDPGVGFEIALVIAVLYFFGHLAAFLIWKHNYRFAFTPEFIYLHTGVISQSEKHIPYRTVQDVTVSQSVLDRIFGLANVVIENAATSGFAPSGKGLAVLNTTNKITIPGQTPANASKITDVLKELVLAKNPSQTGL